MEPETSPVPAPPEAPRMGAMARIIGVITSPRETFTDIGRAPSALAPIALFMVLGLAFAWTMNQRIEWGTYIRQQAEKNPRFEQMSEDQKQRALAPQIKFAPMFAYGFGAVGAPLLILITSTVFLLALNVAGGAGLSFKQSFGVVAHGLVPSTIGSVLGILTMFLRRPGDVDPENILASHVGAFLPEGVPRWMFVMGSSFEAFWIWCLITIAIGYSAAVGAKKLSTGKAATVIFSVWLVWVLLKTGLSAAFS